jgi:hypothetical protein
MKLTGASNAEMSAFRVVSNNSSLGLINDIAPNGVRHRGVDILADGATDEVGALDYAN